MLKSFIFTITIAVLSSVVNCQYRPCDSRVSQFCDALCKKSTEYTDVVCGATSGGAYCTGHLIGDEGRESPCRKAVEETCKTFNYDFPKAVCFCKGGSTQKCAVNGLL